MVHYSFQGAVFLDRTPERLQTEQVARVPGDRPADDLAGIHVDDRIQVNEITEQATLCEVSTPNLIGSSHQKPTDQIRIIDLHARLRSPRSHHFFHARIQDLVLDLLWPWLE